MSIIGGIISGVGSLFGGIGSSAINNKAVQDTNKANMEIAKYQAQWQQQENEKAFQRSLNMWNLQNENSKNHVLPVLLPNQRKLLTRNDETP